MAQAMAGRIVLEREEYNPAAVQSEGVTETHTESEERIMEGVDKALAHAGEIAKRWDVRNAKEGKKLWYNPLQPRDQREYFDTEAQVNAVLRTSPYRIQVKAAKLAKEPLAKYTPQFIVQSPKRTLADFMPPRQVAIAEAARSVMPVQNLGKVNTNTNINGRAMTAGVLMGMQEGLAIKRVKELSDRELQALLHKATFNGKKQLVKAANKEITARKGLPPMRPA